MQDVMVFVGWAILPQNCPKNLFPPSVRPAFNAGRIVLMINGFPNSGFSVHECITCFMAMRATLMVFRDDEWLSAHRQELRDALKGNSLFDAFRVLSEDEKALTSL